MSLALVQSRALLGLQAPAVTVEVHLANGLPSFTLVGLARCTSTVTAGACSPRRARLCTKARLMKLFLPRWVRFVGF